MKHQTKKLTILRILLKANDFLTPATRRPVIRNVIRPARRSGVWPVEQTNKKAKKRFIFN